MIVVTNCYLYVYKLRFAKLAPNGVVDLYCQISFIFLYFVLKYIIEWIKICFAFN